MLSFTPQQSFSSPTANTPPKINNLSKSPIRVQESISVNSRFKKLEASSTTRRKTSDEWDAEAFEALSEMSKAKRKRSETFSPESQVNNKKQTKTYLGMAGELLFGAK